VSRPISLVCFVLIVISFFLQSRLSKIELPAIEAEEKTEL